VGDGDALLTSPPTGESRRQGETPSLNAIDVQQRIVARFRAFARLDEIDHTLIEPAGEGRRSGYSLGCANERRPTPAAPRLRP
jgi:hypothetical protein